MKEKINYKKTAVFEIVLLISVSFAFAYIINHTTGNPGEKIIVQKNVRSVSLLNFIGKLLFSEKGIVSAAGEVATCVNSLSGKSCQEYPIESCNQECGGDCVPSTRENVAACKPGTCYDPLEGTCQAGSPQSTCVAHGGTWSGEKYENIPQCREGCCIINSQAKFVTERQCVRSAELLGVKKEFRPDVQTEIACLALGSVQEEGACVFEQEFERTCKFTTRSQCGTMHGDFYSQRICSSPSLNTTCKPQVTTGCFPGKDEVYWFDSCGNRENIFALPKAASWNNGGVLLKNNSCSLGSGTNLLANVKTCGNCNYIAGSVCGRADERNPVSLGEYVCKDLSCIDEQGKKRKHGESWCSYQGAIGEDTAKNRARDTPGSRHFREVCINGEIRTEPCADYRNEICVEAQTPIQGGKFSSAACRINKWQQCFDYNSIVNNPENKGIGKSAMQAKSNQRDLKCEENTDCFVKEVKVGKDFKFDYCVPKYSPGFSLSQRGEGAEIICRQANQKCTVVYVKGLGGWDCKANCECEKKIFAEQMNDLCMSLGDCGAEVNYIGDLTENYKVKKSPKLNSAYLENIKRYANEKLFKGEYADAGDISEFFATLGIPEGLGSASTPGDPAAQFGMAGTVAGMMGVALVWAAGTATGAGILGSLSLAHVGAELLGPTTNGAALTVNPGLSAAGGALAGAAIGFALTSLLLQFTGVGRGLPPAITYSLLAAGTAGGAIAGFGAMGGSAFGAAAGTLLTIGIIIVVVVIIVIVIFKALGIGEVKKVKVTFECKPWQPPRGGADCAKCGSDGKTCSRYSCESLGQTCQLINEETGTPECIDISPNDAAAPSIRFMKELLANYSVEETEFGVRIKQPGSDGCIPESYEPLILGVALDEPGQCRISNSTGVAFEEMESDFGSSLFKRNQTMPLLTPSLSDFGLESFNPNARAEYVLHIKCQDKSGNTNIKDYGIGFCIKQGPDTTPPIVVEREPSLTTVAYNLTMLNGGVYTNEPADCRWDSIDRDYSLMSHEMSCENDFEDRQLFGWFCSGEFPVTENTSKYYVRCQDQPWLNVSSQNTTIHRNANSQSYTYNLQRTINPLIIESLVPNNETLNFGTIPASIEVVVKTSGGVDGSARCTYKWGNSSYIDFAEGLWTSTNSQIFQTIYDGIYSLPVRCEDLAGNTAEKTARFKVNLDSESPKVTRVYENGGSLTLITDEPSVCTASTAVPSRGANGCDYEFANATEMSGSELVHSIGFSRAITHYIKCKDKFGRNPGSACTIIVKGGVAQEL